MSLSNSSDMVREPLDELDEELQTVASLVHLSIKNQQQQQQHVVDLGDAAFDCSGDAERRFQALKSEVQTLARAVDSKGSSLAASTSEHLGEVNRLAAQAARCKSVVDALDALIQAEELLTSSQQLLAKNEYTSAADAISNAETLLLDLQQAESASSKPGAVPGAWRGAGKENRRNVASGGDSGVLRALKRLLLKRKTGLESHLRDVAYASVEFGKDGTTMRCRKVLSGMVLKRHFRSPVPISAVFDALGRLGLLSDLFGELSTRLRKEAIDPLLSAKHVPLPKRNSDNGSASLMYAPSSSSTTGVAGIMGSVLEKRQFGSKPTAGVGGGTGGAGAGSSSDASEEEPAVMAEILNRVLTVLEFFHEEVLDGNRSLTAAMGASLLLEPDGLSKALLLKLDDHVPHNAQHLSDFERGARDACHDFEDRLASMGYFGEDQSGEAASEARTTTRGNLCRFVDNVDVRFAAKRRRTLLEQARNLALGDYHNSVEVSDSVEGSLLTGTVGKELGTYEQSLAKDGGHHLKTFQLEACQVSTVAKALITLIRATLTEACSDQVPPLCAKELFRTARDMLDLFRAVVPVQHGSALEGVPRIAAVFQNDCLYLAHHIVTLGHEFRHNLPPPANFTATMIDTVPLFREMAAQSLSAQQRRQQRQLEEFFSGVDILKSTEGAASLLDAADSAFEGIFMAGDGDQNIPGARGFDGNNTEAFGRGEEGDAAAAVRKSVYHLRQLKQAWCKVLPDRVYKRAMGSLLSLVAGKVCTPVFRARDLGEEQTHALHRVFKTLGDAAQDLFGSTLEAEQNTPGWAKAVVVGQMMELGLETIGEMLQGDTFRPLSADELGGLVKAIFQDTPARSAIFAAIGGES